MTRNDSVSAWWRTLLAALVVSKVLAAAAAQSDCTSVPGSQIPRSASTFQAYPHSDDATDCPALCDKWATTCKQVAAAWSKCAGQHYAARFKMADAVCATSPTDVQRDVCEAHVDADRETYGRAETADIAEAQDLCEALVAECLSKCPPIPCSSSAAPQCNGFCPPAYECDAPFFEYGDGCFCQPIHP